MPVLIQSATASGVANCAALRLVWQPAPHRRSVRVGDFGAKQRPRDGSHLVPKNRRELDRRDGLLQLHAVQTPPILRIAVLRAGARVPRRLLRPAGLPRLLWERPVLPAVALHHLPRYGGLPRQFISIATTTRRRKKDEPDVDATTRNVRPGRASDVALFHVAKTRFRLFSRQRPLCMCVKLPPSFSLVATTLPTFYRNFSAATYYVSDLAVDRSRI